MVYDLASLIDHTILKPEATLHEIKKFCSEALEYKFASVCVNPTWVKDAAGFLKGSNVKVCTVIGFPLGATTSETKAFETKSIIQEGATEVDMVMNIGALKEGRDSLVEQDIRAVVNAANRTATVKVIIETSLLTREEKIRACELSVKAGADFVKTSTGFSTGGATIEDIQLMRKIVGPDIGVKASGGVRDARAVEAMIEAGATRIGSSSGVAILKGLVGTTTY